MEIPTTAYPAIASVVAALIAGGIAFVSVILAKEQKTSEFRQSWIDALRADISEFIGFAEVFAAFVLLKHQQGGKDEGLKYIESIDEDIKKIGGIYYRICLRLNPEEHQKLIDPLTDLFLMFSGGKVNVLDPDGVEAKVKEISVETQTVLKQEWKRVKSGERPFRITKYVSIALFTAAILLASLYLFGHLSISWVS